ncbi:glycosyl hydrolase family 28 protein [Echinicola jeungdonensis]|uniref:Glycosyl hydrolase family 28 protein n=1 Tax=Echinicola jeungdonensis TaxID=709343 RepID=A0ABV5J9B9_9BACT|nr:glycosyl hydrolase family 28 protein [Echinicola jeungdonensis]MDN3670472.1 glycosyl hydrolase family 28 protein [Echinicola jeungdonensis]
MLSITQYKPTYLTCVKGLVKMVAFLVTVFPLSLKAQELVTYQAPEGALLNEDFTVKVRIPGKEWKNLPEYLIKVDEVVGGKHTVKESSMSYFDFSGEVEVMVKSKKGRIETAKVRPLSYEIMPYVKGDVMTFKLSEPRNLSVEVNGDIFHNLHLFANPVLDSIPDKDDPNVIYFGAGIHEFEDNKFLVPSNKTVYISGDAILRGQLLIHDAENVKVIGRGMVEHTVKMGVHISNSNNVLVEGIFTTQCATGGSKDMTIRNVKSISYYGWGDGMNVFASNNVLYDGVFCRNSDDCTTVYATRKDFIGGAKNITMQNSTLWADVAHPIFIGIHGNAENPDVIEDLTFKNIDILDHKETQIDYQGCLAINGGDNNLIRNVRFEDIRIEDFRQGQLINLRIFYNKKYCKAPGKGIENVLFKNISYIGNNAELSIISGYNEERGIKNIRFENLSVNGEIIHDHMEGKPSWYKTSDLANIYVGEHVEGVSFIKTDD